MSEFDFSNSDTAGEIMGEWPGVGEARGDTNNMGSRSFTCVAAGIRRMARCITEWESSSCVNGVDPIAGDAKRRRAVPAPVPAALLERAS